MSGTSPSLAPKENPEKTIFPVAEFYDFCEKSEPKISYKEWMENPSIAVIDLNLFKTKLQTKLNQPNLNAAEKTKLGNQITAIDSFLNNLGTNPSREQVEKIVKKLDYHENNFTTFSEKKEKLGKDVIIENVYKVWESAKELAEKYPVPSIIVGVAMLWLLKDRLKTPTGKVITLGIAAVVGWLGFSKVAEAASNGKVTLGRETLGNFIGSIGKGPENYTQLFEQLGLDNEYGKEIAAVCDVPVKILIDLYKEQRKPGVKKEINLKDSRLRGFLGSKKLKILNGNLLYRALDDLFGKDYEDPLGKMHKRGDLLLSYEHSDLSFGNFLLNLSKIEDLSGINEFRSAASKLVAATVVNTITGAVKMTVSGLIIFPLETGKEILWDKTTKKWFFENKEFDNAADALRAADIAEK